MVLDNLNVTQTADLGDSSHPSSLGENPKHKILTLASINPYPREIVEIESDGDKTTNRKNWEFLN